MCYIITENIYYQTRLNPCSLSSHLTCETHPESKSLNGCIAKGSEAGAERSGSHMPNAERTRNKDVQCTYIFTCLYSQAMASNGVTHTQCIELLTGFVLCVMKMS